MAHALRARAINRGGKNSVCNLRYSPRTRLVRGINSSMSKIQLRKLVLLILKSVLSDKDIFIKILFYMYMYLVIIVKMTGTLKSVAGKQKMTIKLHVVVQLIAI